MKKLVKSVALLLGIGVLPTFSSAQEPTIIEDEMPNSILFVSTNKAGKALIDILEETKLPHFHDAKPPRFMLTTKNGLFSLGIGGYVKATAEYDFEGIVDDVDFYPALIPNKGSGNYARNQFQMDITTSNLFLQLVGHTRRLGNIIVHVGGNFRGNGSTFELQNAYASFLGFTAGYTYGTFMDAAAGPATVDFAGPGGMTFYRATQLSYKYSFLKHWKVNASIEMPDVNGTVNNDVSIKTQRMPNFGAYGQYDWGSQSHVRVGGIIRSMTYNSNVCKKAYSKVGWGVQASTTFKFLKNFQTFGQFTYGRGIGSYLNDLSNLNVDIVPDPAKEGRMQTLPMMGWYAGLQYNFTPKIFMSATYSQSKLMSEHGYPSSQPEYFKKGHYFVANAFWNVTSYLQTGIEYLHGKRIDFNNQGRNANRVNLSVQYNF